MLRSRLAPSLATVAAVALSAASAARAEAPMNTDDAGTLDRGAMKVEATWARDDKERGGELLFGIGAAPDLELEVSLGRARDTSAQPATQLHGTGIGAKWVPIRNETGWSLGARLDHGRTRVSDRATPARFTERDAALTGLASWRSGNGHALHANFGAARAGAQGTRSTVGTWGLGYEFPVSAALQLTAEVFGARHSRPDKALGLRYELFDGFKLSGAIGRGSGRDFGQVGFAWEF